MKGAASMEPSSVRLLTPREDEDAEFAKRRVLVVIIVSSPPKRLFLLLTAVLSSHS
jgi:hypothetical protein